MKIIALILLFISAAAAFRNLIGLPETKSNKLHQLLKDGPFDATELMNYRSNSKATARLASVFKKSVNDHEDEESGPEPTPESEPIFKEIRAVADSLSMVSALKKLNKASEERNKETAQEFIHALQNEDDSDVREVLGRHVMENHERCNRAKEYFVRYIHESDLVELLKSEDALDLQEEVGKILENAKINQGDVFEEFSNLVNEHRLHDHPGVKVAMILGGMLTDAYCDIKLDGLFKMIGELLEHSDPHGKFDVSNKVFPYLSGLKNGHCKAPVFSDIYKRDHQPEQSSGIMERILGLVFPLYNEHRCNEEVKIIRFVLEIILDSVKLSGKFAGLHHIVKGHEAELIKKVTEFAKEGKMNLAEELVGQYLLDNLRGGIIVAEAIRGYFESHGPQASPKPSPKSSPKPSHHSGAHSSSKPSPKSSPKPSHHSGAHASSKPSPKPSPKPSHQADAH